MGVGRGFFVLFVCSFVVPNMHTRISACGILCVR